MPSASLKVPKTVSQNGKAPVAVEEVENLEADSRPEEQHSYVPHPDYALKYVGRVLDGVKDFDLLQFCMDNRLNLLLRGPTGSGKTMFPMAWAATLGLNFYAVPCDVSMEPSALFGQMMPDGNGSFAWQDGPVTELVRAGGVLCISEANFMSPKIAASLFPLLDHRRELPLLRHRGEIVKAHEKLLIVTDYNPNYRGTMQLNEAFLNRFQVKQDWGYNDAVEDKLVQSAELLKLARAIRVNNQFKTPVSTNSMMEFLRLAVHLGYNFAANNFANMFESSERGSAVNLLDAHSVGIKDQVAALAKKELGPKADKVVPDKEYDVSWKLGSQDKPEDFAWEEE
jgi:MoxR-like ATPase